MPLDTTRPCRRSGPANSAAYWALPVTLRGPSTRFVGRPIWGSAFMVGLLADALVGLRLRRARRRLTECTHDGAPREIDLEGVVRITLRLFQNTVRYFYESGPLRRPALESRLRLQVAPRFVGN